MTKSLLLPNERDFIDAHADLDQDLIYYECITKIQQEGNPTSNDYRYSWAFEAVDGFFKQSEEGTDDMTFNYSTEDFGILKPWEEIISEIKQLNVRSDQNECYKVLFLARHGQGWHNVASQKYSKEEWLKKWRFLGTDGEITWGPDATLTVLGINQAKENNTVWKQQIEKGAPIPAKFYVSPLSRSSHTLACTWEGVDISTPKVIENLRETIGIHLCHKRSAKSEISQRFPNFIFEDGFPEEDELHEKFCETREQLHEQFVRINGVLQNIFEEDWDNNRVDKGKSIANTFISVTSHAGTIRSFITVIGHRKFTIPTGGMIPIVVKGTKRV